MPLFSIIMATRDRPILFSEALTSVLAQHFQDSEIIVVDDGSSDSHRFAYDEVIAQARSKVGNHLQFYSLVSRPRGHGQSYALNFGVSRASGTYVCFLDDDDSWTDPYHLARVAKVIGNTTVGKQVDLFMANQTAFFKGEQRPGPDWLEALASEMQARNEQPDSDGCYLVSIKDLLLTAGFCHVNCLVVRRGLFDQIGGMDEGIRWECDHDLFLRLIDKALFMLHHPAVVSRHNIPDPAKTNNMTTAISMLEKRLFQLRVFDKAALFAEHPEVKGHARLYKGYILKLITLELRNLGRWTDTAYYARIAFGAGPTFKWGLFMLYCVARAIFKR